jgi:hypothetical protein
MILDATYQERAWWGPRPAELQAWVMGPGRAMTKEDRYREVRRWYARDHGATTVNEVLSLIAAAPGGTGAPVTIAGLQDAATGGPPAGPGTG